jgi:hypothetical protein
MKSIVIGLLLLSAGAQANWTEDLQPDPNQPRGGMLPVIIGSAPDATGDAFGAGMPNLDVSGVSAYLVGGNINIGMNFATPISPADSGNADAVIGFIEIDADQNSATGNPPAYDIFCPQPTSLGVEYLINLGSVTGGQVAVEDTNGTIGTVPISFTANSFSIDLPLSLIGNPPNVHMASVIGTIPEPTDCAPDNALLAAGVPSIPVPTLSQWMLLLLASVLIVLGFVYVRKTSRS